MTTPSDFGEATMNAMSRSTSELPSAPVRKSITRIAGNEFCRLEVELHLQEEMHVLSVCGSHGHLETRKDLVTCAIDTFEEYFSTAEGRAFAGIEHGSARRAARAYVNTNDDAWMSDVIGEHQVGRTRKYLKVSSCGQIRPELNAWFPEYKKYFEWHLNDMRAGCVHQDARGERDEMWLKGRGTVKPHTTSGEPLICPDCGWKWGHGWNKRLLPASVILWFQSLPPASTTLLKEVP